LGGLGGLGGLSLRIMDAPLMMGPFGASRPATVNWPEQGIGGGGRAAYGLADNV